MRYLTNILLASSLLAGVHAQAATEINYWLWDNNQLPSYRACADAFEKCGRHAHSQGYQQRGERAVRIIARNFSY